MKNKIDKDYQENIKKESNLWNKAAEDELKKSPPDYSYYKKTWPYLIYRNPFVIKMLNKISEGGKALELGCYNGWFSLEMARKGARVEAHDISPKSIRIAKTYYEKCKEKEKFTGSISYHITDLNYPNFPKNIYDVVVIRNVLHHLINLDDLFLQLFRSLKSNGLILIDDALPCGQKEALLSGILLTLFPTDIPYSKKLQRIFKKRNILKRTQGLVDAKGASPFESISSGDKSVKYLKKYFNVTHFSTFSAFVGTIAAHISFNKFLKKLTLKMLNIIDRFLIKIGLLKGTCFFLIAIKQKIKVK
ncbi:class I SAM-dependent methyltransferase [Patescibacteria group bacterium]|nr:class I SAM-dependent methyltransferase [Patescibacteria group bacterium]